MFQFLHVAGYKVLSFLVLPFLLSLGNPAPAHKSTVPLKAPAVQGGCYTTLTFSGTNPVARNGSATYQVNNWNGRCVLWYYNGTYVTTYNGSITLNFVGGAPSTVTALQHTDCLPGGPVYACGNLILSFY